MKITDQNWVVGYPCQATRDKLLDFAKSRGVKTAEDSRHFNNKATSGYLWAGIGDGIHTSADPDASAYHPEIISVYQFRQMCNEYSAENKPQQNDFTFFVDGIELVPKAEVNNGQFYCLVEGGLTPPKHIHRTLGAAKTEARRLVEQTGKKVRILRAMLEVAPAGRYIETQL